MTPEQAVVGAWVQSNIDFAGVPKGSFALIRRDYGTGVMIEWQRVEARTMFMDGFDKARDLGYLDLVIDLVWVPRVQNPNGTWDVIDLAGKFPRTKEECLDFLAIHAHRDFPGLRGRRIDLLEEPAAWHHGK